MTEEHIINMTDKYCTREHYNKCIAEGKEVTSNVRVLCVDRNNKYFPVIALLNNGENYTYTKDGRLCKNMNNESFNDLIKIPTKKEGWMTIYPDNSKSEIFDNKKDCDYLSGLPDPKIVKVWWYE